MISIEIPDLGKLSLAHIVCDYNGTLALDGTLLPRVKEVINSIHDAKVHVITADTFGFAQQQLADVTCRLAIAPESRQDVWKRDYIQNLNAAYTACIGNGRNDALMLEAAALGIALIQKEGASLFTLKNADIVCTSIIDALEYFSHPKRLIATLRV